MERRKPGKRMSASVPEDYIRLVNELLDRNFGTVLKAIKKKHKTSQPKFMARGSLFPDEIVLSLSLQMDPKSVVSTTVHASSDYDPAASVPKAEELLAACLDAAGGVLGQLLLNGDPKTVDAFVDPSLSELAQVADAPLEWTNVDVGKRQVFVKIDKMHLELEELAEKWLDENDPDRQAFLDQEEKEAEELISERAKTRH